MATALTPPQPGTLTHRALPLLCLLALVAGQVYTVYFLLRHVPTSAASDSQEVEFVLRRLDMPIVLPQGVALPGSQFNELFVLAILLLVPLAYVGWKYAREGRSLGWPRASFFAASRLIAVMLCLFLALYTKEAGELAQKIGVRGGLTVLLVATLLAYLLIRFNADRKAGWARAPLVTALRLIVLLCLLVPLLLPPGPKPPKAPEISGMWWLAVLIPVLIGALAYAVWMYVHDTVTIGWPWAAFLANLRCTCFLVLAAIFLLPAWQRWDRSETRSRVSLLTDVSGSMNTKDDLPSEAVPVEKLPGRQDKVIRFLTDDQVAFLKRLQEKNPVAIYRFGGRLDEDFQLFENEKQWSMSEWDAWLKPNPKEELPAGLPPEEQEKVRKRLDLQQQLVGSTSVADALLGALNREANNLLQGVVILSDGRSTQFSEQAFEMLRGRARKARVPIFTVAVGEHRQPINIRITDLQAPEQARPDDKFPVRVEVDGEGLPDKEVAVTLDIAGPNGLKKQLEKPLKFSPGSGGPPHGQTEFEIDAAALGLTPAESKKAELDEGEWAFRARIPRDKREVHLDPQHVSEKATVQVVKKPLRVLLFAQTASREFQFVRNLFVREADARRAEVSVCLQLAREGVVQDVSPDRLLKHFPDRFTSEEAPDDKAEDKYYNLARYDLVIAFDPDWTQLEPVQQAMLDRWVNAHAGGLVLVAGPVNTFQLARPGNRERLKPIIDLFPVVLQDSRLQGIGNARPTTEPWPLHFPGATAEHEFLKLEEEAKENLAGWGEFFAGKARGATEPGQPRGFYNFYPVDSVKPVATVVGTFSDPRANLRDGREQPYLVTMPYGSGRVVYLGYGETWRLRGFHEVFHERFWTKLGRYAGSGTMNRLGNRGVLVMGREFTAGQFVRLEAQLFGRDLKELTRTALPKVRFVQMPLGATMPTSVELQAKPGSGADWRGWFQGRFRVMMPGEYRVELQVPETGDLLPRRFHVKESNPELDNTRPDFGPLYQLASDAAEILPRLHDKQAQTELLRELEVTAARLVPSAEEPRTEDKAALPVSKADVRERGTPRLFFDLTTARLIPNCMVTDSRLHRSRGPFEDLWDRGFNLSETQQMSFALLVLVALWSVEWLTRKLLRLA